MYKSLNIKLVLIFIIFIISVMATVGVFLLNSVFSFYTNDFITQTEDSIDGIVKERLNENLKYADFAKAQKQLLLAYSGSFGFDQNRHFYILDMQGNVLQSSADEEKSLIKTRNLLAAMNKKAGFKQSLGADFMDYALYLQNNGHECIIYIKDNLSRMRTLSWMLFTIIIQALLVGLLIAVIMSFFLAKAITSPIQNLTRGTMQIATGDYTHRLVNHSRDEIGVLTRNFNAMAQVIENTLAQVSGEREKLKTILDCLEDGVAAFDENGILLHINPQALSMLSLSENAEPSFEEFTERLKTPDITLAVVNALHHTVTVSEHKLSEIQNRELIADIGFTVFSYDNKKVGYIVVIQDVTERSLLEQSRREFIANVSHELRTPLTSIKGATETILTDDEMPKNIRVRFLNIVMNESDRMSRIVKDLLVLSRLDNRRMTWTPTKFKLFDSVSQICAALKMQAKPRRHTLEFHGDEDSLPEMIADKERVEQVLTNIIGNAIKYTPDGGIIKVETQRISGDKVEIKVSDNGIGIPKEDIPHLFERFYRVDKSRASDAGGTGLGLSIAKDIIDAHHGSISVQSVEKVGTTVTIILPTDTRVGEKNDEEDL